MAKKQSTAAPAPAGTEEQQPVQSKRDAFRGRVSQRYPDLDMDDEDAYYDQMGGMMDDYEGYEKSAGALRESMSNSPAMLEMIVAARNQDDFDPIVWLTRQKGLDLRSLLDDPEYTDKLAQAHSEYLADEAKGREVQDEMKSNMPQTLEATRSALEAAGMGDQYEEVVGKIFQLADDISHGKWDPEIAVTLAKGGGYDNAVDQAREEGTAQGRNTKVNDSLRKMDRTQERVNGTQTPPTPQNPSNADEDNMFLA